MFPFLLCVGFYFFIVNSFPVGIVCVFVFVCVRKREACVQWVVKVVFHLSLPVP